MAKMEGLEAEMEVAEKEMAEMEVVEAEMEVA